MKQVLIALLLFGCLANNAATKMDSVLDEALNASLYALSEIGGTLHRYADWVAYEPSTQRFWATARAPERLKEFLAQLSPEEGPIFLRVFGEFFKRVILIDLAYVASLLGALPSFVWREKFLLYRDNPKVAEESAFYKVPIKFGNPAREYMLTIRLPYVQELGSFLKRYVLGIENSLSDPLVKVNPFLSALFIQNNQEQDAFEQERAIAAYYEKIKHELYAILQILVPKFDHENQQQFSNKNEREIKKQKEENVAMLEKLSLAFYGRKEIVPSVLVHDEL